MGNQFITMQRLANAALAHLYNTTVFAHQVHRDFESEFVGSPTGGKVLIRKPAVFQAKEFNRANGIEIQDATEDTIEAALGPILDVSFGVSDEDMTNTIERFEERLLVPAMEAIVQGVDAKVAGLIADVATQTTGDVSDPKVLANAAALLTSKNVPLANRKAIVGPMTYGDWITKPPFDKADSSGSTDALREANLGRAYGFDTFQSNAALPGTDKGVAFHRDAFALVTRTLNVPKGATGAVASHDGFGVRVLYGYDLAKKQSTVSVDLMVGVKTIDANRAVVLPGA